MTEAVYVFPGQGSHRVGMGRDFVRSSAAARAMLDQAETRTGVPLERLMFRGPLAELTMTRNQQLAICVTEAICLAAMAEARVPRPRAVAGHSLGELTACYAAGVFDYDALVALAFERGRLMQAAADAHPGGMIAVAPVGEAEIAVLLQVADDGRRISLANRNAPGEVVLSGEMEALARVEVVARQRDLRTKWLQVSGPWHSAVMASAAQPFAAVLAGQPFCEAELPVYSALDGTASRDPDRLKRCLVGQIAAPVEWERTCRQMRLDHPEARFVEVGPGKVLTGLILRIDARAAVKRVEDKATLAALCRSQTGIADDDNGRAAARG